MVTVIRPVFILLIPFVAFCQQTDRAVLSLLEAERAFAQMANERNTRDAFLQFLSDDAITAAPGEGPRKGKDHLFSQEPNASLLSWRPVAGVVASSGDFGYTTGPWQFSRSKTDREPIAWGQFVSVWKKGKDGWRVALDIGISHQSPEIALPLTATRLKTPHETSIDTILEVERAFIVSYNERGNEAFADQVANRSVFFRPGEQPTTTNSSPVIQDSSPERLNYTLLGGDVASSGDLAFAYGKVVRIKGDKSSTHSYVRIWQREDGIWKIAIDLVSD